jgi:hypothetical protein
MSGHHLILGELTDFLSGQILQDTLDERYRQKIARLLVLEKGYLKNEIDAGRKLSVCAGEFKGLVPIDFIIRIDGRIGMMIKYGPGSLVTRRRPAVGMSRLIAPYQIPVVVVTNGEDAEIIEGSSGEVIFTGINAILSKVQLSDKMADARFEPISQKRAEMESRIVYTYEIDGACPCDDTVCRLK